MEVKEVVHILNHMNIFEIIGFSFLMIFIFALVIPFCIYMVIGMYQINRIDKECLEYLRRKERWRKNKFFGNYDVKESEKK